MSTPRLLLTDADSPMGQVLWRALEREPYSLHAPDAELDWTQLPQVAEYLRELRPTMVVNCRGWAQIPNPVHQAQLVAAARALAPICAEQNIIPLHLSSYRVFGGETRGSYSESCQPSPLGEEGQAFYRAERFFEQSLERWLCLRLSWVISASGHNLMTRLLSGLYCGETVTVDSRRRGVPTLDADVARVVVAIVRQVLCGAENWGAFHYCSDPCSEAEFARLLVSHLEEAGELRGELKVIESGDSDDDEPASAVLTQRRCRDNFGIQRRTWRQGLGMAVRRWLQLQKEEVAASEAS